MQDVFYIFPSANPDAAMRCANQWRQRGYGTAVLLDPDQSFPNDWFTPDVLLNLEYRGYPDAIANLCAAVSGLCDIVVLGGDDILPDPDHAPDVIADQFRGRFPDLFGVMQPMGDTYGALAPGAERAAVSPWVGRGWIDRAYGGRGPLCAEYGHLFSDAELWLVAAKQGVLWERPDLTQYHAHWSRGHEDNLPADKRQRIVDRAANDRRIFRRRLAEGFPGHQPLPASAVRQEVA